MNCLIGTASKNSFPKNITGPFLIALKLFTHLTFEFLINLICVFFKKLLFSYKNIFIDSLSSGKFFIVLIKTFVKLPSPGPSSTKLKLLGFPNFSQQDISQIVTISENKLDIVGAVIKSPFFPKGIFLCNTQILYDKVLFQ